MRDLGVIEGINGGREKEKNTTREMEGEHEEEEEGIHDGGKLGG